MKLLTLLLLCVVAVGCGYGSNYNKTTPPQPASTPTITQLNPSGVVAGSQSFTLEVDGSSFASNAVVNFNSTAETTTWVSANKVMATIPSSAITTAGTVPVTVTNQAVTGGIYGGGTTAVTSKAMSFTIQ